MLIAASPANGQEHTGLGTEPPGEVTPTRVAQLDKRLQAVEEAVSQLCTLHEQTLQLVAQLYDVMTAQKAQDIQSVKEVLRKAQHYGEQTRVRQPTPVPAL